ncbi:MAG: hypothetical protein ABSC90_17770, partial [Acidimicrobiales bacterium]
MSTGLMAALGARLFGGHHGHHGLRILVLVVLVAVVAVVVILLIKRSRARRPDESPVSRPAAGSTEAVA